MPDKKYEEWKDNLPEGTDEIVEEVKELHGFNDEGMDDILKWAYEVEKKHLDKIKQRIEMEKYCSEAVPTEVEKEIDAVIDDDIAEMRQRMGKNDKTD